MSRRTAVLFAVTAALLGARLAAGQGPAAAPGPNHPEKDYGRLGGGYRDAKWGNSISKVTERLGGRVEYRTQLPKVLKTLRLDLGEGRKVTCLFDHEKFYQAIYQPVAVDDDQQAAEAVMVGLERKYGPGKNEDGYTDKDGRPLKIVTWNDGISKIEFRMRDPKPPERTKDQAAWSYPSSTIAVIYTDIIHNAKLEQRQDAERQHSEAQKEKKNRKKVQDIQGDL